ncbi:MAG: U32 family peptidase [Nitrospinae bacterium]|nr:U32 family peptidase [Nitrospinota bacterium]
MEEKTVSFGVADNLDDELIDVLKSYPVQEIYGKLAEDVVGGGRASILIPSISRKKFEQHVRNAHNAGIKYNYLLNAACLDNQEITRNGQKKIRELLDWISSMGVERVTVSNPLLLKTIKKSYPNISVRISVFAGVDHVRKARMWQDMGADSITLDSMLVNREFSTLEAIRKYTDIDLQLMVNNSCMTSCAMSQGHMGFLAHASQSSHHTGGFSPDYCYISCSKMKMDERVNYIRADWIRPEDLKAYTDIGYNYFKITERTAPTYILKKRVKAYAEQSYEGNLLDLIQPFSYPEPKEGEKGKAGGVSQLRFIWKFAKPWMSNPLKLLKMNKLAQKRNMLTPRKGEAPVIIDNKKLDGFLERFKTSGCRDLDCELCRYCHDWAEKTVHVGEAYEKECQELYKECTDLMESGSLWKY